MVDRTGGGYGPDLEEEEMLRELLDQLVPNILWEELRFELKLNGVLPWHILVHHLGGGGGGGGGGGEVPNYLFSWIKFK